MLYYPADFNTVFRTEWEARTVNPDSHYPAIRIDADLIYNHSGDSCWSIWSDGLIRDFVIVEMICESDGKTSETRKYVRVSSVENSPVASSAVAFIDLIVRAERVHLPTWAGRIRKAIEQNAVAIGPSRGPYAGKSLTPWNLVLDDDSVKKVFVIFLGPPNGHVFDLYESLEEAVDAMIDQDTDWKQGK